MKNLIVLAIAVFIGIVVYRSLNKKKANGNTSPNQEGLFEGPDVDNVTGAYLPAGTAPGTVQFSAQGN